jgi:CRP-like cAMP-binding protein
MYELFTQFLTHKVTLSELELAQILSKFKPIAIKKHQVFAHKGEIPNNLYFVNKGCVRAYYIRENGAEATHFISIEGQFITIFSSILTGNPSKLFLDAVENSELIYINKTDFFQLVEKIPAFKIVYKTTLEQMSLYNIFRLEGLMSMDAAERYDDFMTTYPDLIHRLPNKIIASYLGISPESLSRLKSKK